MFKTGHEIIHPYLRMVSDRKEAGAMGGRSARACDNCVKNRARFYCAADDAFLCRPCDTSVHSANALARRHERVRLRIFISSGDELRVPGPTWHRGFTRKARTPRRRKKNGKFLINSDGNNNNNNRVHVVPEIGGDEESEDHLQLLYRVPMLDPELSMANGVVARDVKATSSGPEVDLGSLLAGKSRWQEEDELNDIGEFEFLEDRVKIEAFDQNLEYSRILCRPEREEEDHKIINNKKPFLRLDYEGVLSKWDVQRSPWMAGERPTGDCWADISGGGGRCMAADGGREARVWRYKEKRQRRLFSKRIMYEVRKRNAEKRPRVKGRFVKRV